jgi:ABC-2 type transport system permease protein
MRDIALITTASIRNILRSKIIVAITIAVLLICVIGTVAALCILAIAPAVEVETPDVHMLEIYLSVTVYAACLIGIGINMDVFAFQSLMREKSRGVIESLLATPLKVKDIWIAKSMAVFLPGLILGEVFALISLLAINYIYFVPKIGFLFNPWIAVSCFVCAPLIYLCLSLLVHLIGLTGQPATGNMIVQVFLPIIANLMINLGIHRVLDATSWTFTLVSFGLAGIIGIVAILLRPRLTRERIVLSR